MKRILTNNGNTQEIFHYCEHDNTAVIQRRTDIDPLTRRVQRLREAKKGKNYGSQVMNYAGSVDMTLFRKWGEKKFISAQELFANTKYLTQYLNDPDNAKFKAIDGKI